MKGLKKKYPQADKAVVKKDPEEAIAPISTNGGNSELPVSKGESSATILNPDNDLNVTSSIKNAKVSMSNYHIRVA